MRDWDSSEKQEKKRGCGVVGYSLGHQAEVSIPT